MSRLTFVVAAAACLTMSLALTSACGGQSFTQGGNAGSGATGNTGSGGSGQAGTHTTGGKSTGGTSHGGSGQGGFASAGTGGTVPGDRCSAPPESGNCNAYFQRWYHDPASNQCLQFVWGGCGGNDNNYDSFEACHAACGSVSPTACNLPSDCAITPIGCCGICDGPAVVASQFVAFNKQFAGQYQCGIGAKELPAPDLPGNPGPGGGAPIACPPCAAPAPGQGTAKYFIPDCVKGQCVVADLRKSPLTACMSQTDCRLRNGTQCCEGCGGSEQWVAVRSNGGFEKQACGSTDLGCPACLPQPPVNVVPYCNPTTAHCEVAYQYPAGG